MSQMTIDTPESVLATLRRLSSPDGIVFTTFPEIASQSDFDVGTVRAAIGVLQHEGRITRIKAGTWRVLP